MKRMSVNTPIAEINKGDILRVGELIYEIRAIEELKYSYTQTSLATLTTTTVNLTDLRPNAEYIYWIKGIGINGLLNFQLYYPRETPRNAPTANSVQYWDRFTAHWLNPAFINFVIPPEILEPSVRIYNPQAFACASILHFTGLKLKVRRIGPSESIPSGAKVIFVPNYTDQDS
jgi:hypothetical protein